MIARMKSFVRLFFLLLLFICFFVLQANARGAQENQTAKKLSYTLEPIQDTYSLRLRVELRFEGNSTGSTILVLPSSWSTQSRLYSAVKRLELLSASAKLSDTVEENIKVISHAPNQELHIKYELVQDSIGPPSTTRGSAYRPILEPSYFHFLGNTWVRPLWDAGETIAFFLEWKNLPNKWTIANSFGTNERQQSFQATFGAFIQSVYVGGDFRISSTSVNEKPIFVAMRGAWRFTDAEFANLVQKVFLVERGFWNDYDYPYYLITLLPLEDPQGGVFYGGTGLTKSFAAFATKNIKLGDMKPLLSHELFHNWNAIKLGKLKPPYQVLYWFSEGFTDYYAYLLLLRSGLITLDEYVDENNTMLRNYYFSSVRNATNERVLNDFFKDDEISKLPYWRGRILAANWNALIQSATGGKYSLDDVMRDLFNEAKQQKGRELNSEAIASQVRVYTKQDVMPDIKRYIEDGETITPDKTALGQCVEQETIEVGTFELGFDLNMLRSNKIIMGVKPDSAAYKAGLRDGQRVARHTSIYYGDAGQRIGITIKEGLKEKTISFYPASAAKIRVPQYKIKSGLSNKELLSCTQNAVTSN